MEYQEWFNLYEVDLNKEFCNVNGQGFLDFCKREFDEGVQR